MNKRYLFYISRCLSLAALVLLAGCGPKQLPKSDTYPVTGTVRLHGEPAKYVIVRLEPTVPGKGADAEGTTKEDGTFELRTYANEENDGAVPGEYKVFIEQFDPVRSGTLPKGAKPTAVPNGAIDTGIVIEIKSEPNTPEIVVP